MPEDYVTATSSQLLHGVYHFALIECARPGSEVYRDAVLVEINRELYYIERSDVSCRDVLHTIRLETLGVLALLIQRT